MRRLRDSYLGVFITLVVSSSAYGAWSGISFAVKIIGNGAFWAWALAGFCFLLLILRLMLLPEEDKGTIIGVVISMAMSFGFCVFLYSNGIPIAIWLIGAATPWVIHYRLIVPLTIAAWIASLLLAYAAFRFRKVSKRAYGHAEILFGVVTIVGSVGNYSLDPFKVGVGLFGGVYIIVRGLTNLEEGIAPVPVTLLNYFADMGELVLSLFTTRAPLVVDDATPPRSNE